jgi:hypothetical protein
VSLSERRDARRLAAAVTAAILVHAGLFVAIPYLTSLDTSPLPDYGPVIVRVELPEAILEPELPAAPVAAPEPQPAPAAKPAPAPAAKPVVRTPAPAAKPAPAPAAVAPAAPTRTAGTSAFRQSGATTGVSAGAAEASSHGPRRDDRWNHDPRAGEQRSGEVNSPRPDRATSTPGSSTNPRGTAVGHDGCCRNGARQPRRRGPAGATSRGKSHRGEGARVRGRTERRTRLSPGLLYEVRIVHRDAEGS